MAGLVGAAAEPCVQGVSGGAGVPLGEGARRLPLQLPSACAEETQAAGLEPLHCGECCAPLPGAAAARAKPAPSDARSLSGGPFA